MLPGLRRLRLLQIAARNQVIIHGTEHRTHCNTNQHHLLTHRRATARTRQKHHHSRRRKTANNSAHAHTHTGRTQRPNQHHRQGTGRRTHRETDNIRRTQSITRNRLKNSARQAQSRTHHHGGKHTRQTLIQHQLTLNLRALTLKNQAKHLIRAHLITTKHQGGDRRHHKHRHHQQGTRNRGAVTPRDTHRPGYRTRHNAHNKTSQKPGPTNQMNYAQQGGEHDADRAPTREAGPPPRAPAPSYPCGSSSRRAHRYSNAAPEPSAPGHR